MPLGEGRGERHLGSPGFLQGFALRILPPKIARVLRVFFFVVVLLPSLNWGHRFPQNALHCEHLSAGGGPPTSEQGPGGVSITAFFKNKPGAAVDFGLTVCMCRDICL